MRTPQVEHADCDGQGTPPPPDQLTIGQLARLTGMNAKTIRYYEEIGLLPPPPRGSNGYRRYGAADLNRLHLLRRIRFLGVPLSVAKPLLAGAGDARCVDVQHELLALVHQRLRALDQEIAELRQLRAAVEGYQRALDACPPEATSQSFGTCTDMRCIALPPEQRQSQEETYGF
jgi:DNA-binding transcriptional MerR regulator